MAGQWILVVKHGDHLYFYSDFMQVRSLYYVAEEGLVCSSFGPLHSTMGGQADSYKCFEFLAMRHCLYPIWLGNTTLNVRISSLRGFEYIKIGLTDKRFEIKELTFSLNNTKAGSLEEATALLRNAIEQIVASPEHREYPAHTTITGGFDSRMISSVVLKHYPDAKLRIAAFGETQTMDLRIAKKMAQSWHKPLDIFKTDKQTQKEIFYGLTDGLALQENVITTELILHTDAHRIGFGGVMGTEILMSLSFERTEALITTYTAQARSNLRPSEKFLNRFTEALRKEFSTIAAHYKLKSSETEEKDSIRLFVVGVTSRFCAPQVAAFDIYGRQLEPLATYPALAAALRIPYLLMGGKGTLGGYYLVSKTIMRTLDRRASLIDSTHFSPMHPFGPRTFFAYAFGKLRLRRYMAARRQTQQLEPKPIVAETADWSYRSTEWSEGFASRYLARFKK